MGPQRAAGYGSPGAQRFSNFKEVSMSRKRIAGFLFIVFVLAACSVAIAQAKKQLDINTATEEEMVAIGIEKAAAKKIIDARPYRNKSELVSKQLLTRTQYDKLKDLIVARQAAAIKEVPTKPAGK
jgi:DNA uptake protein ComE-like DNA-binding protein